MVGLQRRRGLRLGLDARLGLDKGGPAHRSCPAGSSGWRFRSVDQGPPAPASGPTLQTEKPPLWFYVGGAGGVPPTS